VGKARIQPSSEASERFINSLGLCFTNKQYTSLESVARSKDSSLLRKFVTYGRKKFYNIGPMMKIFATHSLIVPKFKLL